jgi:hypothetical protein
VVDKFAAIGGGESLFYFLEEPFVVIDQALDGFHYQGLAVATLFGGQAGELFLQVGIESYFHWFSVEMQRNIVNNRLGAIQRSGRAGLADSNLRSSQ